jgi:pyruvate,water dikinase
MIEPDSAGVLFTRSPESEDDCLIESCWGLGVTAVGGGAVDRAIVSRRERSVRLEVTEKTEMAVMVAEGGVLRIPCPPELATTPSVDETFARELVEMGLRIERLLGGAVDVEWARAAGAPHLLQARRVFPIDRWADPPPARHYDLWSRALMAELFPDPITPFTWSLAAEHWSDIRREYYRMIGLRDVGETFFFRLHDYRLYFNVGAGYHLRSDRLGRPSQTMAPHASSSEPPDRYGFRSRRPRLWRMTRGLPGLIRRLFLAHMTMRRARREFASAEDIARRFRALPHDGTPAELWSRFGKLWDEFRRLEMIEGVVDESVFAASRRLEILCHHWLRDQRPMAHLLRDSRGSEPAAVEALVAMAQSASDDLRHAVLNRPFQDLTRAIADEEPWSEPLRAFLLRHGHRARGELEWSQQRWAEDPTPVLAALRGYLGNGRPHGAVAGEEATEKEIYARLALLPGERWVPWRRALFSLILGQVRAMLPLRSVPRDRVMLVSLEGRRILIRLGEEFVLTGALTQPDEIFYLTVAEIEETIRRTSTPTWRWQIARRRELIERARRRPPPEVIDADGRPVVEQGAPRQTRVGDERSLEGRAAAPGRARGRVRIVRTGQDAQGVQVGEVLVLAASDIGSTLLFPLASAVILQRGGLLSHATVLARELGLPAVVDVADAARLRDGTVVEVDGSTGRIDILEEAQVPR